MNRGAKRYTQTVQQQVIETYRKHLVAIQEELNERLSKPQDEARPVSPDNAIGRLTRVDAMQSQQMMLALRQSDERRLLRVKQAPRFIDEDRYGTCMKCGEEISEKRLDVVPESILCIHCAR